MLQDDKKVLKDLIKSYSLSDVVRTLSNIVSEEADSFSDMHLKEKANDWKNYSEWLDEVQRGIQD